jgi:hypothetical protein
MTETCSKQQSSQICFQFVSTGFIELQVLEIEKHLTSFRGFKMGAGTGLFGRPESSSVVALLLGRT